MAPPKHRFLYQCKSCDRKLYAPELETRFPHRNPYTAMGCDGPLEFIEKWKHKRSPEAKKRLNRKKTIRRLAKEKAERLRLNTEGRPYYGIDGEGIGREKHRYVFLAACDEHRKNPMYVENSSGLSPEECFDFILSIPKEARIFAFAFNYDLTKIVEGLPNKAIHLLFHAEHRRNQDSRKAPYVIKWKGYTLNLQASKFTIAKGKKSRTVWDVWKFYQSRFVDALKTWKVGSTDMLARMQAMKDSRSELDTVYYLDPQRVRDYCLDECASMGALVHKLDDAHKNAGLKLVSYYGAGSSASALFKKLDIKSKLPEKSYPEFIRHAIACAFFGGRFENAVIGTIKGTVYSYDISSAYPYQTTFLPCLLHGYWQHTLSESDLQSDTAVIRYRLHRSASIKAWGPFSFRSADGSTCCPSESGGGWVWACEYHAGKRLYPDAIEFVEAFEWVRLCDCPSPFATIPQYYLERLRLGADGPGLVLKLALNSIYGKLAQSVGSAPYNSWVWAGMITAGCRAQILEFLALHDDPSNMLMVATDGVFTRERILAPLPRDTGTFHTIKPLGGWDGCSASCPGIGPEHDRHAKTVITKGIFCARPGVYFPLNPTVEELKNVRARGIGKASVYENWDLLVESYNRHGIGKPVFIDRISRFCGAKTSITRSGTSPIDYVYRRAFTKREDRINPVTKEQYIHETPGYGQWVERPIQLSFDPMPKRNGVKKNGRTLRLRRMPMTQTSVPYNPAIKSKEALEFIEEALLNSEQPDPFGPYEFAGD